MCVGSEEICSLSSGLEAGLLYSVYKCPEKEIYDLEQVISSTRRVLKSCFMRLFFPSANESGQTACSAVTNMLGSGQYSGEDLMKRRFRPFRLP